MERAGLERWISDYERVWRAPGTEGLTQLFADSVRYLPSPWEAPVEGIVDLATFWDRRRDGPDEVFTMASEVIAVDGDVGVVRVEVNYGNGERWRDIWIIRLNGERRCVDFEEWPIAPGASSA